MMLDLLLINSPNYDKKSEITEEFLPPFGLGYIATGVKNGGMSV